MTIWYAITPDLFIGDIDRVYAGEFDIVVELGSVPRARVEPTVHHRFIPVATRYRLDPGAVAAAVTWLAPRWRDGRRALVMARGTVHAQYVVAALFVHLGADPDEAETALRQADPPLPVRPVDPSASTALRGAP